MSPTQLSNPFGVMQGRLSPPEDGRFQSFPRKGWRDEFALARDAGFHYIEWIYDDYGASANPLSTSSGITELRQLMARHVIAIPAVCGDWFMDFPLVRCSDAEREQRQEVLATLLHQAALIGAHHLVIPFVDASRIQGEKEKLVVLNALHLALRTAEDVGVEIHLEADFGPEEFAAFLDRIPHPLLKVNWDSGNSSGLGYIASEEFAAYGNRIGSIHIKDRYRKPEGGVETRPLGEGSADFDDVFKCMREVNYSGGITLQVARGKPGDEVDFLRGQLAFVQERWGAATATAHRGASQQRVTACSTETKNWS